MPKGDNCTGPKFTPTEREGVMEMVASLDRQGYNQFDIARMVHSHFGKDLSQPSVSRMLRTIRERYILSQGMERAEQVATSVERYRELYREAFRAWLKSKDGLVRVTEELAPEPIPPRQRGVRGRKVDPIEDVERRLRVVKRTVLTEGRSGAGEFLTIMQRCLEAERELLGLDAPKRTVNVDLVPPTQIDWDALVGETDEVAERLGREERALPGGGGTPPLNGHPNGDR